MTTKMTTKSITRPAVFSVRRPTPFVLILLATLALIAIAVYSQAPIGKTATEGFVAGETFANNGKLILGHRESISPALSVPTNPKMMFGSRGGVGPAWHRGPRTSVAHPPVAEVGQPILQAPPQDNP